LTLRRTISIRTPKDFNLGLEAIAEAVFLCLEVEARLEIEPKPLRRTEEARQTECRIGRTAPLAVHDLVDPAWRYRNALGESVLANVQRYYGGPN